MAGIRADELDVILSRIKLAQLLGRGEGQEHNLTFTADGEELDL